MKVWKFILPRTRRGPRGDTSLVQSRAVQRWRVAVCRGSGQYEARCPGAPPPGPVLLNHASSAVVLSGARPSARASSCEA